MVVYGKIGIYLAIGFHDIVDKPLTLGPPPAGLGTEVPAWSGVLPARDVLGGTLAVALPVELTAGINQSFRVEVAGIEQVAYE